MFIYLISTSEYAAFPEAEQKKLSEAQNEPSTKAKTAKLKQEILRLTKQHLKVAKQYTVSVFASRSAGPPHSFLHRNSCGVSSVIKPRIRAWLWSSCKSVQIKRPLTLSASRRTKNYRIRWLRSTRVMSSF